MYPTKTNTNERPPWPCSGRVNNRVLAIASIRRPARAAPVRFLLLWRQTHETSSQKVSPPWPLPEAKLFHMLSPKALAAPAAAIKQTTPETFIVSVVCGTDCLCRAGCGGLAEK